ncbi:MAG: hypothetical protein JWN48_5732 [Myxococcaceae bacterium]|nr:hypothetical protein [Myxococcaceae bacterium]
MWTLNNQTPYAAERTWVRDKHGVHHWLVAVRGTFTFDEQGTLQLAVEQPPPLRTAVYFGDPGQSSLRYDADLLGMKPATDLTVLGSAYAPHGRPATKVLVGLRIEKLTKSVEVHGDRVYSGTSLLDVSRSTAFARKPLLYEAAYGGADASPGDPARHVRDGRNPVGVGVYGEPGARRGKPAHTIEYPGRDPAKPGPAGFGPLASYWLPRLRHAGTYDAGWEQTKKPLLPDDYDERFTLCAPPDQQFGTYLRGGELLEMLNFTPTGVLRLTLPKIYLTFCTRFGTRSEEHRGRLVSVIVEPDERQLTMVWQSALKVRASDADYLDETLIDEKPYLA